MGCLFTIVTLPFRAVVWLFKTWKWYFACGILAVITIAGVVIFMVATAKKPAAVITYDDHTDLDYSERYPGALPGENAVALLLRRESYHHRRRLRPHPLLVFQQLVGPVGKIRFSHHHSQLWKDRGK